MTRKSQVDSTSRRTFLKELALAGGATAIVSATGTVNAAPITTAPEVKSDAKGYHLTPHINQYYDKARF
ncbi:MAG: twin-arginine translocation signal domain-containing protein [Gammaproteobacteria bacterium]|jgi:outer membrane usher protein FimD/PapC|nr:twin-arginine translocation signal domain-containing protein [Gammaproteobacteria bacterium]